MLGIETACDVSGNAARAERLAAGSPVAVRGSVAQRYRFGTKSTPDVRRARLLGYPGTA
jgi:hypothetical protein